MDEKLNDQIASIIDDVDDITIATIRKDGFPQAAQFEPNEGDPTELCYFRVEPKVISTLDYKKDLDTPNWLRCDSCSDALKPTLTAKDFSQ